MNEVTNLLGIKNIILTNLSGENEINLSHTFIMMNVYEDLFSHYRTARILIEDTNDLQVNFPIIGGEKLEVNFSSKNDEAPVSQEYIVYKLEKDVNVTSTAANSKILILYLTSKEQLLDETCSISRKISGDVPTVLEDMVLKYLKSSKKMDIHKSTNGLNFISNFWTPSQVINYISKVTNFNNLSDFLFFENKEGFNFKSMSGLMKEEPSHSLEFRDDVSSKYNVNVISQFTFNKYFNIIELARKGSLGNTVFQWHDDKYGFNKTKQDFETISVIGTSLGKAARFDNKFANNSKHILTYKNSKVVSIRDQILKALGSYHLLIKLPGDSTKTIGQIYNIDYRIKVKNALELNPLLTGKWFATNINHEFDRNGTYIQNIKVVKNAFFNFDNTTQVKGAKNL